VIADYLDQLAFALSGLHFGNIQMNRRLRLDHDFTLGCKAQPSAAIEIPSGLGSAKIQWYR
jgi:hypothetical protein